jgi:glycosyltransferase involved in cell wall biosynthesis
MVSVASSWVKRDVQSHYGLPADKVQIVPLAPVVREYPEPTEKVIREVREKHGLTSEFAFYPAQTWPHKNHIRLLEALAILRDRHGVVVPLVCAGRLNSFYPQIREAADRLSLTNQVKFLGFVTPVEIQCLYKLSRCAVIPTKFEATSSPLWEAFAAGAPAACSAVTSLPEQAGDAALLFDPDDANEIADVIRRLWSDGALREILAARARERIAGLSWDSSARLFRAHYRRIGGKTLNAEDVGLLREAPWI